MFKTSSRKKLIFLLFLFLNYIQRHERWRFERVFSSTKHSLILCPVPICHFNGPRKKNVTIRGTGSKNIIDFLSFLQ